MDGDAGGAAGAGGQLWAGGGVCGRAQGSQASRVVVAVLRLHSGQASTVVAGN